MSSLRSFAPATWWILAILAICPLLPAAAAAEDQHMRATVDMPATVAVASAGATAVGTDKPNQIVISVTGFQPATDGTVQAVVRIVGSKMGAEQEIGRFSLFPNVAFKADGASHAQRFAFPLPKDVTDSTALSLKVQLVPIMGEGKGATLDVGGAEFR